MKETRLIAFLLGIIVAALVVIILKTLKTVFIPLIFAALLSIILKPVIKYFQRWKIPTGISVTVVILLVFLTIYLLGSIIYAGVASFKRDFPRYESNLRVTLETTLNKINIESEEFRQYFFNINWQKRLNEFSVGDIISNTLGSFFNFLGYTLLILIFTIFLLSGQIHLSQKVNDAFDSAKSRVILRVIGSIQNRIRTYLVVKVFVSFVTALIGLVFLLIFGVDFLVISALLIFILNFIPNIGSIIATLFPIIVCFIEFGYSWRVLAVAASLTAIQMASGNFLEPMMMGRGLNLQPIVLILSLIFWGWVWGIVGMVLAVPLTSTLVIVCENIEPLKPAAVLMSGKKASNY